MQGFRDALPFWCSVLPLGVFLWAMTVGGWAIALVPLAVVGGFALLDAWQGRDTGNRDPMTPEADLLWHRAITLAFGPLQAAALFGFLAYAPRATHLSGGEAAALAAAFGLATGSIGIVFAHELMHRTSRLERWLGDAMMAMALYGHFRSEHLLVHHRYVGTPRDAVTARYNEGFWRFFARVLPQSAVSAWRAERAMLARRGAPWWDRRNPFWRYAALAAAFLALAAAAGGAMGVGLFLLQAFVAVLLLELINYVEHYGLTRKHLGGGRYEPTRAHHSWNADHKVSNWLLINLQRHSDHHCRPDRRFPLLQTYGDAEAPRLPHGYPVMTAMALVPPLWRRRMNPRVRDWRRRFYPEITDWRAYTAGANPQPR